jgi:hypothetical protein
MGNRAVVVFDEAGSISPAIYLHWNGGPESVYAFLAELDSREVRADGEYDAARFIQIVGEFFDQDHHTGLSLGVWNGPAKIDVAEPSFAKLDVGDNGIYVVTRQAPSDTVAGKRFVSQRPVVRRFEMGYDKDWNRTGLAEWTPGRVQRERREAVKDARYLAIRAWFDDNRKPTEREALHV